MSLTTVIVSWSGPYLLDEVKKSDRGDGLYLLVGRRQRERTSQILYCGITQKKFHERVNEHHHKISEIRPESLRIWLGEIAYPATYERALLEKAESCFVSFWQTPLNTRKRVYYPSSAVCFISQWRTRVGRARRNRPTLLGDLPDVLWWDQERCRIGRLRVRAPE